MNDPRIESVFSAALEKETGVERDAYLEGACMGDPDLRSRVDVLLQAHDDAGNFLKPPATEAAAGSEGAGTTIGRYKLLQEIGEGGFGVVYMAEQQEPVQRKVALKVIKLGMDTKQVVARFESERQALAMMDHPNIARALDAGATDSGRPYFVMELVRGIPITQYCDQHNLPAVERLRLFIDVCHAIQHAHQKGIIHRDLKPSNVLVTLHDGTPIPKVIDFGIAKATNQRLTEKTLFTEFQQFIGTPQYMSPEQAEMSGLDIDTRSDIYSLGVLLYELLTGTTPFEAETLRDAGYSQLQKIIREQDPPSPSARISTLQDAVEIARHRSSEPEALRKIVRGDLDWIVMKALEKDRTRRYETAKELAADVARHLANEPVLAGPPSVGYKLQKFFRRNRVAVLTTALVGTALLIGLSVAILGLVQANREAAHSQAIGDFLQEMLSSVDPQEAVDRDVDVASVVKRTRELFGDDHATTAATLSSLALQLQHSGKLDAAEPLYREALKIWRDIHGDKHVSIGITLTRLGQLLQEKGDDLAAEQALREGIANTKDLPGSAQLASCDARFELAQLLMRRNQFAEAEQHLRETIRLRRERKSNENGFLVGMALEQLVLALTSQGKLDEAEETLLQTIDAYTPAFPPDSLRAGTLNAACGLWLRQHGRAEKAEPYLREAIRIFRQHDNPPPDYYLASLDGLFQLVRRKDDTDETIAVFRETMENMAAFYGGNAAVIAPQYFGFASALQARGRDVESIPLLLEGIRIRRAENVDQWKDADKRMKQLAEVTRRVAVAAGLTKQQYEVALTAQRTLSEATPLEGDSMDDNRLGLSGILQYRLGEYDSAQEQLESIDYSSLAPSAATLQCRAFLAMTLFQLKQPSDAERQLEEAAKLLELAPEADREIGRTTIAEATALIGRPSLSTNNEETNEE